MKIETEFSIGDEVWFVLMDEASVRYEVIGPKAIGFIEIYVNNGGDVQVFYVSKDFYGVGLTPSDQVFKTREAAEITAEALNK